jgi:hypothetical protein
MVIRTSPNCIAIREESNGIDVRGVVSESCCTLSCPNIPHLREGERKRERREAERDRDRERGQQVLKTREKEEGENEKRTLAVVSHDPEAKI